MTTLAELRKHQVYIVRELWIYQDNTSGIFDLGFLYQVDVLIRFGESHVSQFTSLVYEVVFDTTVYYIEFAEGKVSLLTKLPNRHFLTLLAS